MVCTGVVGSTALRPRQSLQIPFGRCYRMLFN
jgi:hypothetical protein